MSSTQGTLPELVPRQIPKRIWIYWHQGWDVAPPITRVCKSSWIAMNPGWHIVELDSQVARAYADLSSSIEGKTLELRWIADILRLQLLADFGGVWVDATTFCTVSLDHWLLPLMQTGFFGFARPGGDRPLSNWFLAAEREHPIVLRWSDLTRSYWSERQKPHRSFWQHDLFRQLCERDRDLEAIWLNTPQVSADGPHAIQHRALATSNTDDLFAIVRERRVAVHKLSWKVTYPPTFPGTPLAALLGVDRFSE